MDQAGPVDAEEIWWAPHRETALGGTPEEGYAWRVGLSIRRPIGGGVRQRRLTRRPGHCEVGGPQQFDFDATYSGERGNPPLLPKHDLTVELQGREAPLNNSPYNVKIHAKVLMNEDIPSAVMLRHAISGYRRLKSWREILDGLANHFEIPDDRILISSLGSRLSALPAIPHSAIRIPPSERRTLP